MTKLHAILACALMSMVPVVELRGALPMGIAMGLDPWLAYAVCVVCNMIPVPFIILFIRKILVWMDRAGGSLAKISDWVENKARSKMAVYYKYNVIGLFIFVAIPAPGTGAWTGALIAAFLDLRLRNAIPAIFLGVAAAGLIMSFVTHSVIALW